MIIDGFDLAGWADRIRMAPIPGGDDDLVALSDMEVALFLTRVGDAYEVQTADRGRNRRTEATFSASEDGYRYLVVFIGESWRFGTGRSSTRPAGPAPGTRLEGSTLTWKGGTAEFRRAQEGITFSRFVTASLPDIAADFGGNAAREDC